MRPEIDIPNIGDEFAIHFGVKNNRINVEAFTHSIQEFSKALKEVEKFFDHDQEIEICIDGFRDGSIWTLIKLLKGEVSVAKVALIAILSLLYWAIDLDSKEDTEIKENSDGVSIIVKDSNGVSISELTVNINNPEIDYKKLAKEVDKFSRNSKIDRVYNNLFYHLGSDSRIRSLGIAQSMNDNDMIIEFGQDKISQLSNRRKSGLSEDKFVQTELLILRAAFASRHMFWEFQLPNKEIIKARILDSIFHKNIEEGKKSFTKGDRLKVKLRIRIDLEHDNENRYAVTKVY